MLIGQSPFEDHLSYSTVVRSSTVIRRATVFRDLFQLKSQLRHSLRNNRPRNTDCRDWNAVLNRDSH